MFPENMINFQTCFSINYAFIIWLIQPTSHLYGYHQFQKDPVSSYKIYLNCLMIFYFKINSTRKS